MEDKEPITWHKKTHLEFRIEFDLERGVKIRSDFNLPAGGHSIKHPIPTKRGAIKRTNGPH